MIIDHGIPYQSLSMIDKIYFSLHSPNILPDLVVPGEDFAEIKFGYDYELSYSYIKTEHLEHYEHDCVNYDLDYVHDNSVRSDCIFNCIKTLAKCPSTNEPYSFLMRREYFGSKPAFKLETCRIRRLHMTNHRSVCEDQCTISCTFIYYTLDINIGERLYKKFGETYTKSSINLRHNQLPDYLVKHIPEFTFISFVCNFGGILSLWLGFNILTISWALTKFVTKFVVSKCTQTNKLFIMPVNANVKINNTLLVSVKHKKHPVIVKDYSNNWYVQSSHR